MSAPDTYDGGPTVFAGILRLPDIEALAVRYLTADRLAELADNKRRTDRVSDEQQTSEVQIKTDGVHLGDVGVVVDGKVFLDVSPEQMIRAALKQLTRYDPKHYQSSGEAHAIIKLREALFWLTFDPRDQ